MDHKDYLRESRRLREFASQTRASSIENRLKTAFTLCQLVETELNCGDTAEARKLLGRIEHFAQEFDRHLNEPNYVPDSALLFLFQRVGRLQSEIRKLKNSLLPSNEALGHCPDCDLTNN